MSNGGADGLLGRKELVFRTVLITLIVVGTIMRVYQVFANNPLDYLQRDCQDNVNWALSPKPTSLEDMLHPPGFPIFLAIILRITGLNHSLVAIPMALLSVITPYVWYRWLRELTPDKNAALMGYLAFTFMRSYFQIFSYLMDLTLLLPLTGAGLWLTWRAARKTSWGSCLAAATCCGAAIVTKVIAAPVLLLAWAYVAYKLCLRMPKTSALKVVATSMIIIVCFYALGPLRIWANTGAIVLSPHRFSQAHYESGAVEIDVNHYYNHIDGSTWQESEAWTSLLFPPLYPFNSWITNRHGKVKVDVDYRKGWDDMTPINMSFSDRMRFTFENIVYFFLGVHWPDDIVDIQAPWPVSMLPMDRFLWLPLTLLLFAVILLKRRREFTGWYFIAVTLAFMLQQSTIMTGRYSKPWQGVALGICFWAIAGSKWYQRLGQRFFRSAAPVTEDAQ